MVQSINLYDLPNSDGSSLEVGIPLEFDSVAYITQAYGGSRSHTGFLYYSLDFAVPGTDVGNRVELSNALPSAESVAVHNGVPEGPADSEHDPTGESLGDGNLGNFVTVRSDEGNGEFTYATMMHLVDDNEYPLNEGATGGFVGLTGERDGYHVHITYSDETGIGADGFPYARRNDGLVQPRPSEDDSAPVSFDTAVGTLFEGVVTEQTYDASSIQNIRSSGGTDIEDNIFLVGDADAHLTGNGQGNIISGNSGENVIAGLGGADAIWGGEGNDEIYGEGGNTDTDNDTVSPGDTIFGGGGIDTIYGGSQGDWIHGDSGEYRLWLTQASSSDRGYGLLHLSTFDDGVVGGGPVDFRYESPLTAVADVGDDLRGDSGNDTIFGGAGNDTIFGGTGNDIIFGGGDNDILFGEQGDDTLIGGSGNDTAVVAEIDAEGNNAFLVQLTGDGGVRLTHQVLNGTTVGAGSDGSDVLYEVERVRFGANGEEFTIEQVTAAGFLYKGDTFIEANGRLSLGNLDRGIIVTNLAVLSGSRGDYLFSETTDGVNVQRLTGIGAGETFELIDTEYVQLAGMQVVRFDKILSPIPAPEDDHSDTRGTATPINDLDGTVVRGEIEVSGDEDYFTFSTQAGRTYGVVVTPDGSAVDPEIRVYNSSGQLVASNDDFNGVSSAATSFTSSGGTYYVKVAGEDGSTGDYGLGVALLTDGSGDDAPGDAPEPDADLDVDTGRSVTHEGDNGEDTWLFSSSSSTEVFIDARGGDDRVVTGRRDDIVFGGDGEDDIETNGGNDTVSGGDDDDTIDGGSGDDGLVGGDGDDSIEGGSGHDILVGERGKDTLKGDTGDDVISGGEGDDRLDGEDGDDGVLGGDGDDNIDGGDGDDVLYGQDDEDDIDGEDGDDRLYGGNGRDDLNGGEGNDLLDGGDGDDILLGGAGNDRLEGGRDDDLIRPGQGDDEVDGDGGHDTLSYEQTDGGSVIDMNTETARGPEVGLDTFDSIDDVIGTRGRDLILGDGQDNYIDGIHDRDTISGGGGDDSLDGGSSSDTVIYSGNRRDYAITVSTIAGYDFQVVDLRGGSPDGTDQVNSFSFFQFADITIRDDDVLSSAPLAVSDRFEFCSIGPKVLDVLANDADPDGNPLSIIEVSEIPMDTSVYTVGDSIVIDLQNAISFGEIRAFSFSYSISDQTGWLSEADVTVSIDLRNVVPTIEGSSGHEQLTGTDLREILMGLAGNDTLLGGGGADELDGGSGFDLASYEGAGERVNLDLRTRGTAGDAAGDTFISIEGVIASDHDDYVYGNSADNFIFGDQGHDRLRGDGGDDTLEGGSGRDDIHGGSGDDTVSFATAGSGVTANLTSGVGTRGNANGDTYTSVENLLGSEHEDLLTGSSGNNLIEGGRGNDTLRGSAGNDTLEGGIGGDELHGGSGVDLASFATAGSGVTANLTSGHGSRGNANGDTYIAIENLLGSEHADLLTGSSGNNVIEGGRGNDTLRGSAGNDRLEGGIAGDEVNGGSGTDSAAFATAGAGVTVNLTAGEGTRGNANGDTYISIENVIGSNHDDIITGSSGRNILVGGRGDDLLRGSAGNDVMRGGLGNDTLNGGSGADEFRFDAALNVDANVDTIENYSLSHDRISLDDRVFAAIGSSLSSSEFRIGSSAQDGNDYVIYNSTTGALYYDEDGAGAAAQVQFATLTVGIALTVSEFDIV